MPLRIYIGSPPGEQQKALQFLRLSGATAVHPVGGFGVGVMGTTDNPDSAEADLIVEALHVDMKKEAFQNLWLEEVEKA